MNICFRKIVHINKNFVNKSTCVFELYITCKSELFIATYTAANLNVLTPELITRSAGSYRMTFQGNCSFFFLPDPSSCL